MYQGCSPLHTEQTGNCKGVHPTNGNKAIGCILYQTRVLCQTRQTCFLTIVKSGFVFFYTKFRSNAYIQSLMNAHINSCAYYWKEKPPYTLKKSVWWFFVEWSYYVLQMSFLPTLSALIITTNFGSIKLSSLSSYPKG